MPFDFRSLNLEAVETSSGGGALQPGRYICKVQDVEIKATKSGGKQLEVKFAEVNGAGTIRHWINLHTPSSPEATRIGLEQLKALLVHGNHPNPNHPGDIATLRGLVVGVAVREDTYVKNGEERTGSKVHYVFPQDEGADTPSAPVMSGGVNEVAQDRIPF